MSNRLNRPVSNQPRSSYPRAQNTYQPTRGPGGRLEAPRDNVMIGSQALNFASNIARQIRNRQSSQPAQPTSSNNRNIQRPVNRAPPRRSVGPSGPVARAAPSQPAAIAA